MRCSTTAAPTSRCVRVLVGWLVGDALLLLRPEIQSPIGGSQLQCGAHEGAYMNAECGAASAAAFAWPGRRRAHSAPMLGPLLAARLQDGSGRWNLFGGKLAWDQRAIVGELGGQGTSGCKRGSML